MACLSLGTIDKYLIAILVGCIFCFLNRLLNKIKIDTDLFEGTVISNICLSLSRFLSGIPYIILKIKKKIKRKNTNSKNQNRTKSFLFNEKIEKEAKGKWRFIILLSFIFLVLSFFLNESFKIKTNTWISYILFSSLFYYLIFKIRLYRHHFLSIVLIVLLGLVIDIITRNLQKEINNEPIKLVMKYLKQIFFSIYNVITKYIMEEKYVSV